MICVFVKFCTSIAGVGVVLLLYTVQRTDVIFPFQHSFGLLQLLLSDLLNPAAPFW